MRRRRRRRRKHKNKNPSFYGEFPTYNKIRRYLKSLARRYPETVRVEQIGHSLQGKSIDMVIIQRRQYFPKNAVMIEGGIHAREWISHTTVLYIIDYILRHPKMLEYMDYYIIPCVNPDGYIYTHTCNRLWRKNMNPNGSSKESEWGVDINRNFPFAYGRCGSSADPSSFKYRGEYSLSEPETQSVVRALNVYGKYVKLYLAIHCYGSLIMYPWGFTESRIYDERELRACGNAAKRAMKCVFRDSQFEVGQLAKAMYLSSGGSSDYARAVHMIKFSYTIELQRGGESGFTHRPTQILRIAREITLGIKAMIKHVHHYYSKKRKRSRSCSSGSLTPPPKRRKVHHSSSCYYLPSFDNI